MSNLMGRIFTSAGPLNRWGTPATATGTVTNSRAVKRRASHKAQSILPSVFIEEDEPASLAPAPAPAPPLGNQGHINLQTNYYAPGLVFAFRIGFCGNNIGTPFPSAYDYITVDEISIKFRIDNQNPASDASLNIVSVFGVVVGTAQWTASVTGSSGGIITCKAPTPGLELKPTGPNLQGYYFFNDTPSPWINIEVVQGEDTWFKRSDPGHDEDYMPIIVTPLSAPLVPTPIEVTIERPLLGQNPKEIRFDLSSYQFLGSTYYFKEFGIVLASTGGYPIWPTGSPGIQPPASGQWPEYAPFLITGEVVGGFLYLSTVTSKEDPDETYLAPMSAADLNSCFMMQWSLTTPPSFAQSIYLFAAASPWEDNNFIIDKYGTKIQLIAAS